MITVPENIIAIYPYYESYRGRHDEVYMSLKGHSKRDWMNTHTYFCLPLTIGNQYGFGVKSIYDFTVYWNGGTYPNDINLEFHNSEDKNLQTINSHFGMGILTIQTGFTLRTPPNVNLITMNPPNHFIDGISNLTGVVECDNLRRDFTFNIKVTRSNHKIRINKGDLLSAFLPYPRNYFDNFKIEDAYNFLTKEQIEEERKCGNEFDRERKQDDPKKPYGNGRRYFDGIDAWGNKFPFLHQKNLFKDGEHKEKLKKDLQGE